MWSFVYSYFDFGVRFELGFGDVMVIVFRRYALVGRCGLYGGL